MVPTCIIQRQLGRRPSKGVLASLNSISCLRLPPPRHKDTILASLAKHTGVSPASIVWRASAEMMKEEGAAAPPPAAAAAAVEADAEAAAEAEAAPAAEEAAAAPAAPPAAAEVVVMEAGLRFVSDPLGQKTGFYSDQRESRAVLGALAAGRSVLDLCCFSGGFALVAAAGGAASALGVDSSAAAVAAAARNAELNGLAGAATFQKADVAAFMRDAAAAGRQWDILVLDPPKLAPTRKALPGALRKYRRLNAAAMRLVAPGGLLMTCSCSGAVAQGGAFMPMLADAARDAGRRLTVLRTAGAAACHPQDPAYPEGNYLSNVLLRVT